MKQIRFIVWCIAGAPWLVLLVWFFAAATHQPKPLIAAEASGALTNNEVRLRVEWMNDAVYYTTNNMVWDDEKNKTLPELSYYFYTKTVIYTNRADAVYFPFKDGLVELGAREDGVIVWRPRK